jgi:hypothetical protein
MAADDARQRGSIPVIAARRIEPPTTEEAMRRMEVARILREDAEKREAAKAARELALKSKATVPDYFTLMAFAWKAAMDVCEWNECEHCTTALALFGLTREDL